MIHGTSNRIVISIQHGMGPLRRVVQRCTQELLATAGGVQAGRADPVAQLRRTALSLCEAHDETAADQFRTLLRDEVMPALRRTAGHQTALQDVLQLRVELTEWLIGQKEADPTLYSDLAHLCLELGIQGPSLSDADTTLSWLERGCAASEKLVALDPNTASHWMRLADAHQAIARRTDRARRADVVTHLLRALEAREQLERMGATAPTLTHALSALYGRLADLGHLVDRDPRLGADHTAHWRLRGLVLAERLAADQPENRSVQYLVVEQCLRTARAAARDNFDHARPYFRRAQTVAETLQRHLPDDIQALTLLRRVYSTCRDFAVRYKDDEGAQWARKSVDILAIACAHHPGHQHLQADYGTACLALARDLARVDCNEALAVTHQAITVFESLSTAWPDDKGYLSQLAGAYESACDLIETADPAKARQRALRALTARERSAELNERARGALWPLMASLSRLLRLDKASRPTEALQWVTRLISVQEQLAGPATADAPSLRGLASSYRTAAELATRVGSPTAPDWRRKADEAQGRSQGITGG